MMVSSAITGAWTNSRVLEHAACFLGKAILLTFIPLPFMRRVILKPLFEECGCFLDGLFLSFFFVSLIISKCCEVITVLLLICNPG